MNYEDEARILNRIMMETMKFGCDNFNAPFSQSEMNVLRIVYENSQNKELVNMSETSKVLEISKPALTQIVNKLFFKGYIKRYRIKGDFKNAYLKLTNKGMTRYKAFDEITIGFISDFINKIGVEDSRKLGEILEKFNIAMRDIKQKGAETNA